jgi:hypothetical protein
MTTKRLTLLLGVFCVSGAACAGVAPRSRTKINVPDEEPDSRLHRDRIPLPV